VEDAVRDVSVVDARHPGAHRAEQRLDDHVAAELVEGLERVVAALAGDRPRRRQAGPGQKDGGEELVHRALDRARAVDHPHAPGRQHVQRVEAEHDVLQRAPRDPPDDHRVTRAELDVAAADGRAAVLDRARQPGHGGEGARVAGRAQRALEALGVPAPRGPEDGDAQR
jgi:hypothetical protein